MSRSSSAERAQRLNAAFDLLMQGHAVAPAAATLAKEFALSQRQAYRYLLQARQIKCPAVVPTPRVAMTIKVPGDIAASLREHAHATGSTIGDVVSRALLALLARERRRG